MIRLCLKIWGVAVILLVAALSLAGCPVTEPPVPVVPTPMTSPASPGQSCSPAGEFGQRPDGRPMVCSGNLVWRPL